MDSIAFVSISSQPVIWVFYVERAWKERGKLSFAFPDCCTLSIPLSLEGNKIWASKVHI